MKRALLPALALAWVSSVHAVEPMPRHLTGVWSTAESLYAGSTGQSELVLLEDGSGAIGFSSPPATSTAGPDKGRLLPNQRVILGFAFRARVEGEVLVLQPLVKPDGRGEQPPPVRLTYRQGADGATLGSPDKAIPGEALKRRSETVPEQVAGMIAAYLAEASAPRPVPATPP